MKSLFLLESAQSFSRLGFMFGIIYMVKKSKILLFFIISAACFGQGPADLFYLSPGATNPRAALIILSCTGATRADLDSCKPIADSLGWILAACAKSRNHREALLNDYDIMAVHSQLLAKYPVDRNRIFIYGFSGQGVQALLSVFWHPECFRGALAICAHDGALELARPEALGDKLFYLVTRQKDWNREANFKMAAFFKKAGIADTLIITRGKHEPKGFGEVLKGCRWLEAKSR